MFALRGRISRTARYALENPSAIREIMTVVTDYKLHPEKYPRKLLYLGGGWPQDPAPEVVREEFLKLGGDKELFREACRYGPTRGEPEFMESVTVYEKEIFGRKATTEEVIVGLGSTELTAAFMLATLDSGSEVILTRPGYLNYERQILVETLMSAKIKRWDIIKDREFAPNTDELQDLITPDTRLIILTAPGNPDGQIFSEETLEAVSDIAEDKGVWVMVDVAYRAFCFEKEPKYYSRPRRENEIWMCSLSKELRILGWRLAYALADPELINAVVTVEQARTLCPSRPAQMIVSRIIGDKDKLKVIKDFYDKGKRRYAEVGLKTYNALKEEIPDIYPLKPMGGFYVFFDASNYSPSSRKVCNDLLNKWQVALAPGLDFGMEGWIRLSFAPVIETPEVVFEAIQRMKEYFKSLK